LDTLITVSKSAEQKRKQLLAMSRISFAKITSSRAAVNSCPSEMIDQIGGWSSGKVGEGYGEGFSVLQIAQWMTGLNLTLWE
jgi:hypothetical protein